MMEKDAKAMTAAERRKAKLAEELRANLMKRKAQVRARREQPYPLPAVEREGGKEENR